MSPTGRNKRASGRHRLVVPDHADMDTDASKKQINPTGPDAHQVCFTVTELETHSAQRPRWRSEEIAVCSGYIAQTAR